MLRQLVGRYSRRLLITLEIDLGLYSRPENAGRDTPIVARNTGGAISRLKLQIRG
jgi:hypothetical protein